jgi:NO-binding membrane sensor protein with MHYT domain
MLFTYDPILVIISVLVSILGAYTCFDLVIQIDKSKHVVNRKLLIGAAFAIGGSIWAMHFVAMLAVKLPVEIRYDVLTTTISGLVSVFMTAVALLVISSASYSLTRTVVAGVIMGAGISSMHYVGMSAIRGNCGLSYSIPWVSISVFIGMLASSASLWAAMKLHGVWRRLVAALVMGISISGVHYTGMLGTSFLPIYRALEFTQPILSSFSLGLVTAITTFVILGGALMTLVPASRFADPVFEQAGNGNLASDNSSSDPDFSDGSAQIEIGYQFDKLPIQKNQKTYFVELIDIVSVSADGHYTTVHTSNSEDHFCNYSLSRVEKELDTRFFLRVHRSHIVNLHHVKSFERQHDKGLISMHNDDHVIPVSRTNIEKLQEALGL